MNCLFTVDEQQLAAIRTIVESRLQAEPWPLLAAGHLVLVADGPLRGIEGFFLNCKPPGRLVVSVSVLQRSVAVEVDSDWVVPLGAGYLSSYLSGRTSQQP
jgi:transcription antitermination factor NusG